MVLLLTSDVNSRKLWGFDLMLLTPDIEDVGDVGRFCVECYYPVARKPDGAVDGVCYIRTTSGNNVLIRVWPDPSKDAYKDQTISFAQFLDLEQGYYKARLVEHNDSIVYVRNIGANEQSRNHSINIGRVRYDHMHIHHTGDVGYMDAWRAAAIILSKKRTPFFQAIEKLDAGDVIGCALSDNYGLVTMANKAHIQLVRRNKIIGEIVNGQPQLLPGCHQYALGVSKVCRP